MPTKTVTVKHETWCDRTEHESISAQEYGSEDDVEICHGALTKIGEEGRGDSGPFAYVDLVEASDRTTGPLVTIELAGSWNRLEVTADWASRFADELEQHAVEIVAAIRKSAALVEASA